MSEINEFAKDLVKRQIEVYNRYKSRKYNMTQPLSVLICCSIILFSDYLEKNGKNTLIEEIKKNDITNKLQKIIIAIYDSNLSKRIKKYKFLNEELKEYEVFFHDLRNEFAHLIETNKSRMKPNDGSFSEIIIANGNIEIHITKKQIKKIITAIDKLLP